MFGVPIKNSLGDTLTSIALGVNVPKLDKKTVDRIWDILSKSSSLNNHLEANGEINFDQMINEFKDASKDIDKTDNSAYIDAGFISSQITSLSKFEI